MATFTVRPEGIIRQPALTMPGNATGSEAACTSLTASQIRTLLSLATTSDVAFAGLTLSGNLLFNATNTYDIGNGTYDPRTVRAATSVLTPLVSNTASQLTLTGGPDAAYFSIPSVLLKTTTSATEYVRFYSGGGVSLLALHSGGASPGHLSYSGSTGQLTIVSQGSPGNIFLKTGPTGSVYCYNNSNAMTSIVASGIASEAATATILGNATYGVTVPGAATFSGDISMQKATQGYIRAYGTGGVNNIAMYDDNTNGILSTSSGNLNLVPGGGTVAVTGAVTASGRITTYAGIVSSPTSASNNPATGVCDLLGTNPAIAWSEFGVDNRGVLGFASGSTTLSYRAGGANFTTYPGTEVFTISSTGNVTCAGITASGVVSHGAYTVATLPAAGSNAGKMAQVTDSNVAASGNYGATVAAGGANRVKVFSDGTNWVIA